MKKLFIILLLALTCTVRAQSVSLSPLTQTLNTQGNPINKGDTVQLAIKYTAPTGGGVTNTTSFYFDFQHQYVGYTLANITFPADGASGTSLPTGTKTSFSNNYYPGYSWAKNAQNTTINGYTNAQYAGYNYTANNGIAIDRIMINYSFPANQVLKTGTMAYLNFIPTTTMPAGYAYDSVYLNFVYGYNPSGALVSTISQPKPASSFIQVSATSNALINGTLRTNSNLPTQFWPSIVFADSATNNVVATFTPSQNGNFTVASQVLPNHTYKVYIQTPGAQAWQMMANTVTVSDFTAAQAEFMHQTLMGNFTQTNIHTGVGYLSSDVNFNGVFDGGDVAVLFNHACGNDSTTIITNGAMTGIMGNPTLPVFLTTTYDSLGINGWSKYKAPNANYVLYHTGTVAQPLNLAYVIPGDITRTFSSPVLSMGANGITIVTFDAVKKPINSINSNGLKVTTFSTNATDYAEVIDVNLNNTTVTSNSINIPFKVNTNGNAISALQFTFVYDTTKLTFNQLQSNVPNTWTTFVKAEGGVVKVTTLDKSLASSINGTSIPFTLNFTAIGNGLNINTAINVLSNMDAADSKGNQVGIQLNSPTIQLTGYNNFN
jgi:hypothetical protein